MHKCPLQVGNFGLLHPPSLKKSYYPPQVGKNGSITPFNATCQNMIGLTFQTYHYFDFYVSNQKLTRGIEGVIDPFFPT